MTAGLDVHKEITKKTNQNTHTTKPTNKKHTEKPNPTLNQPTNKQNKHTPQTNQKPKPTKQQIIKVIQVSG